MQPEIYDYIISISNWIEFFTHIYQILLLEVFLFLEVYWIQVAIFFT